MCNLTIFFAHTLPIYLFIYLFIFRYLSFLFLLTFNLFQIPNYKNVDWKSLHLQLTKNQSFHSSGKIFIKYFCLSITLINTIKACFHKKYVVAFQAQIENNVFLREFLKIIDVKK